MYGECCPARGGTTRIRTAVRGGSFTVVKREVRLYGAVAFTDEAAGITPALQKWNYPQMGQVSAPARTYTAAPTTTPAGSGFPLQYQTGAEGVRPGR